MSDLQSFLDQYLVGVSFDGDKNFNNDNVGRDLGILIKNKRINSGMSQLDLAKKSGINQANISKIEHGNTNITINQLKRLSNALGLTIKIILE